MSQPTMTPRQKQALKTKEAADQRNKLKVALGAGGIGAVTGLFLPIVGGVTLAACGCAAAVGLTTRSDDVGEAARASGQAAASSAEKLGDAFRRNGAREKFLDGVKKTRETLETALKGGGEEPLLLEGQHPPAKKDKGWLARWRGETEAEKREKLDGYGAAGTASEAAALMCRDLAETPPGQRRRVALELIRDLHPDKCDGSLAARAVATTLTRVAVAVRDYLDDAGWDSFEERGADAVAAECAEQVARDDF